MRLLAAYIKEMSGLFRDICFTFTGRFQVDYKKEQLVMQEGDGRYEDFYGKELRDLSVIVGKNGSGKTTLLNLIGNPFEERRGSFNEQYFLLYEIGTERYLVEWMGDFKFENIEGQKNKEHPLFAGAFYFQKEGERMRVIEAPRLLKDRIVYLPAGGRHFDTSGTLWTDCQISEGWLLRSRGRMSRLEYWYEAYLDLYDKKMVQSSVLSLVFPVNAYRQSDWKRQISSVTGRDTKLDFSALVRERPAFSPDDYFCMQSREKESYEGADRGFLHHAESLNDFLTNHINMIVRLFLIQLEWMTDDSGEKLFMERAGAFRKKYAGKVMEWEIEKIREIFQDLRKLFEDRKGDVSKGQEAYDYYIGGIGAYEEFYAAAFRAEAFLCPGVDFFALKMDGACRDDRIRELLRCFDQVEDFYRQQDTRGQEDWRCEEEDLRDERLQMDRLYMEVLPQMSAGEEKLISIIGNLFGEIQKDADRMAIRDFHKDKTFLFLIDEIEREMHPEWSRQFLSYLTRYLSECRLRLADEEYRLEDVNIYIQLILSTHSPFLLSDLHERSVIELERKDGKGFVCQNRLTNKVFAQNIQRIIFHDFFISHGFGALAEQRIQEVLELLNSPGNPDLNPACYPADAKELEEERIRCRNLILEIGEPIVRNKLSWMYRAKFGQEPEDDRAGF